jgi:uncharacterized membrane protein
LHLKLLGAGGALNNRAAAMRNVVQMIVGATLFALALIASSWLLKDKPAGDWVDAALYIGLVCFLSVQAYFAIRGPRKHSE